MNRAKLYKRLEKLHKKHDKFIKAFRTERSEILVKIAHSVIRKAA